MPSIIGALRISLGLETAAFERGSKRAGAEVDALGSRMEKAGFAVGRLGKAIIAGGAAIAGSAIIGQLKDMATRGLELAGSLGEQAQKLGVSVSALQRYRFVADQVGIEQETMDKGLAKITLTLGDLANGAKAPEAALKRLGFGAAEIARISKMSAEEAIPLLSEKFVQLGSESEKLSVLGQFLGKKFGPELKNLFDQGRVGIDAMTASYKALGVEITPEQAKAADDALDAMSKQRAALAAEEAKFSAEHALEIQKMSQSWQEFKLEFFKVTVAVAGGIESFLAQTDARVRAFGIQMRANIRVAVGELLVLQANFKALPGQIVGYISSMVSAIKVQVVDRLGKIWADAKAKIEEVKQVFFDLWDKVTRRSYIPDMVSDIEASMKRLDAVMVAPAKNAAAKTKAEFEKLRADLKPLMDRLFPDIAANLAYLEDERTIMAGVKAGEITFDVGEELKRRRSVESFGLDATDVPGTIYDDIEPLEPQIEKIDAALGLLKRKSEIATVAIAKTFKDMADETLDALQSLTGAIKGGGFLDILSAVVGLGLQLGGIGAFGKTIATRINTPQPPPIAGARAKGGWVRERAAYVVGEQGPELFVPGMRGGIVANDDGHRGGSIAQIVPSPYFNVVVDGRIVGASPAIMSGGAQVAAQRGARAQSRRLA